MIVVAMWLLAFPAAIGLVVFTGIVRERRRERRERERVERIIQRSRAQRDFRLRRARR